jgi:hypothetical protein
MGLFKFSDGIFVEHVRLPLALNGFRGSVYSDAAGFEGGFAQLVSETDKLLHNFLRWQASQRDIFWIAIDICTWHKRMVISFANEIELDLRVVVNELFELVGSEERSDSWGTSTKITKRQLKFS